MSKLIWKSVPRIRLRPRSHVFSSCIPACSSSLFVRSTMAATLDELYLEPFVYSPMNLSAFLKWAMTASEADLDQALQTVYIVDHLFIEDDLRGHHMMPVIIERASLNRVWVVPHRLCTAANCQRCENGRGGYQFRWVGPWTCPQTIDDENTPPQLLIERSFSCRCPLHS